MTGRKRSVNPELLSAHQAEVFRVVEEFRRASRLMRGLAIDAGGKWARPDAAKTHTETMSRASARLAFLGHKAICDDLSTWHSLLEEARTQTGTAAWQCRETARSLAAQINEEIKSIS